MRHAADEAEELDDLAVAETGPGGLPVHKDGQSSGVTTKSAEPTTEIAYDVVRDDAVYLWPYAQAPIPLRENFDVASRFILYIPERFRDSVGPPEQLFVIKADPKCLQIVEQGDGALVVSLF